MSLIYRATSKTTGKSYIGQTILPFNKRKAAHINEAKRTPYSLSCKFHKAIIDLGEDDFEWFIEKDLSNSNLTSKEVKKELRNILVPCQSFLIIYFYTIFNSSFLVLIDKYW